ncbi:hypothetical protein H8356DRAFT_1438049 [Neocallimastix lanati (nom. inval.)]|nr:hypothetical protein H8356DRAFT_1438049 [Neocallimastix sp. JGI-2020a]
MRPPCLNTGPLDLQSNALPAELSRTSDIQPLYQLSYRRILPTRPSGFNILAYSSRFTTEINEKAGSIGPPFSPLKTTFPILFFKRQASYQCILNYHQGRNNSINSLADQVLSDLVKTSTFIYCEDENESNSGVISNWKRMNSSNQNNMCLNSNDINENEKRNANDDSNLNNKSIKESSISNNNNNNNKDIIEKYNREDGIDHDDIDTNLMILILMILIMMILIMMILIMMIMKKMMVL